MTRPKRLHIPIGTKREVAARQGGLCACGCGLIFAAFVAVGPVGRWSIVHRSGVQWDHDPALRLRDVNRMGTDYLPPQLAPFYIVARCRRSHARKTHGTGATTAGTDAGKIRKERRASRKSRPKRKIQSRGFAKVHRPMRSR